jgi:hypothetical protein
MAKGIKSFCTCVALAGVGKLILAAITLASACSIEHCLAWSAMGAVAELLGRGCWVDTGNELTDGRLVTAGVWKGMKCCIRVLLVAAVGRLIVGAIALASANCCSIEYCVAGSSMGAEAELLCLRCWVEDMANGLAEGR